MADLIQRLRDHAARHAEISRFSDEQAQWGRDLLEAAELLEQGAAVQPPPAPPDLIADAANLLKWCDAHWQNHVYEGSPSISFLSKIVGWLARAGYQSSFDDPKCAKCHGTGTEVATSYDNQGGVFHHVVYCSACGGKQTADNGTAGPT